MRFIRRGGRIALVGIVWWIVVLLPTSSAGCGSSAGRDLWRGTKPAAEALSTETERLEKNVRAARAGAADAARTIEAVAVRAERIPAAQPEATSLMRAALSLSGQVVPDLDAALKRVEAVRASAVELGSVAEGMTTLAEERDRWQGEAAREKERADSAVRKWLLLTAAGGFAGILAGGALFVWLSRKVGLTVGLASLAVFATSIALYRWFEWFAWGGLVLIVLAMAALGYGLWRNRHAFRALVLGGQNVKDAFADGVQYTKDEIRRLFNKVHAAAQEDAGGGVEKMVAEVKNGKG